MAVEELVNGVQGIAGGRSDKGSWWTELVNGGAGRSEKELFGAKCLQLLRETGGQPQRYFGGMFSGIAIGHFEEKDLDNGLDVFGAVNEVRHVEPVLPAIAETCGGNIYRVVLRTCWIKD